jgi:hypothetical protein
MNKHDLWNRITSNGCRETTEERFYQALDELSIPETEREQLLMVETMMFDHQNSIYNKDILKQSVEITVNDFLASESYQSIPPEQETEGVRQLLIDFCEVYAKGNFEDPDDIGGIVDWYLKVKEN